MSYDATVTSKGQITIPEEVRDRLDVEEGETLRFRFDEDGSVRLVVPNDPMTDSTRCASGRRGSRSTCRS